MSAKLQKRQGRCAYLVDTDPVEQMPAVHKPPCFLVHLEVAQADQTARIGCQTGRLSSLGVRRDQTSIHYANAKETRRGGDIFLARDRGFCGSEECRQQ
jgi:hypothetical protein